MLSVKNDLNILQDKDGKRLRGYRIEVINDELVVTDEDGDLFEYNPLNKESQRIQETLFNEKQTIIENCLFGVDINPNSVKICRLRLWIELLKNAFYKTPNELETLPNIDINIKCGNSLVSRFSVDTDLKEIMKKSKWSIDGYKKAVDTYRNAESKDQKREMEKLINDIKSDFKSDITSNDPKVKRLYNLNGEITKLTTQQSLFEPDKKEKVLIDKQVQKLIEESKKINIEIEEIKSNKIYENAFEWRFEFPEVLNEQGDFTGFDVVIGNPPYFPLSTMNNELQNYFIKSNYQTFSKGSDIYCLFYELGINILKPNSPICYITSNRFCFTNYGIELRKYISSKNIIKMINFNDVNVFENANVGSLILLLDRSLPSEEEIQLFDFKETSIDMPVDILMKEKSKMLSKNYFSENQWSFDTNDIQKIKSKIESKGIPFAKWKDISINRGVTTGLNKVFIISEDTRNQILQEDPLSAEIIKPVLKGANIKRYSILKPKQYLVYTYTDIDIEKYTGVFNYLTKYKSELEEVYEAKNNQKKWFELRKCSYYDKFFQKKLVWTRLSNVNAFAISTNSELTVDSSSFAVTKDAEFLSAILNSKVVLFYFKLGSVIWGKDGIKWFGNYFDNIPIPVISEENQKPLIELVNKILVIKNENQNNDTSALEKEIDDLVYKLYELTDEEIEIVEQ
jgi:adenine-specific DNA-methyltransferase